jgi:histone deacetylase 1/2
MENANSEEYLQKIKIQVIENLKQTAPAPSVQMTEVPRHGLGFSDDEEAALDDLDEDENPDVRTTQRQWEKRVERTDELEDSDDEDIAKANGVVGRVNGKKRTLNDYSTAPATAGSTAAEDDVPMESGAQSPKEDATEAAVTENAQEKGGVMDVDHEKEEAETQHAISTLPTERKVDDDGDVNMDESTAAADGEGAAPASAAAKEIKTEEAENAGVTAEPAATTAAETAADPAAEDTADGKVEEKKP